MSLSLIDQPVDQQVVILRNLPFKELISICQTNQHFRNICQTRLDDHFRYLTREMFGIKTKIKENWYLTFLTVYTDIIQTSNELIKYRPMNPKYRKYFNFKLFLDEIDTKLTAILKNVINSNKIYDSGDEDSMMIIPRYLMRLPMMY